MRPTAILPRSVRRAGSRGLGRLVGASLERRLARMAAAGRTVIAGPWLGEVGFEILYWIPFLRWALASSGIGPERVIAVSRGGAEPWYRGLCGAYRDVFDYLSPDEFKQKNEARHALAGEQKQVRHSPLDAELLSRLADGLDVTGADVLHPSDMYRLFRPYWWGHTTAAWIHAHARYARYTDPGAGGLRRRFGSGYVAVKIYFNECFPATPANRDLAAGFVRELGARVPVVSLSTGLALDDHLEDAGDGGGAVGIRDALAPRDNLRVQSAIVAGARVVAGTYGGFSYLAPFYGVPSVGLYDRPDGFSRAHLVVAQSAFAQLGDAGLHATAIVRRTPAELADLVLEAADHRSPRHVDR